MVYDRESNFQIVINCAENGFRRILITVNMVRAPRVAVGVAMTQNLVTGKEDDADEANDR